MKMKKIFLSGLLYVTLWSVSVQAQADDYLVDCHNQCQAAKQICSTQATLTLARVNACAAVDEGFGPTYNCQRTCQQNPRTVRFEAVQ